MGCSRGGFGTAIHAAVTPLGHPVTLERTGSECSDCPRRPGLIAGTEVVAVLADKGYDSDANRDTIRAAGAEPYIPSQKNRVQPIGYDRHLYRERNAVERYFARIKPYRRVATRYDKRAANFLDSSGGIHLHHACAGSQKAPRFNQYGLAIS